MSGRERVDELWAARLAGEPLAAADERDLLAALRADAALRQELLEESALDGALRALGRAEGTAEGGAFMAEMRRIARAEADRARFVGDFRRRVDAGARPGGGGTAPRARWILGVCAVAAAGAAALALFARRSPPGPSAQPGEVAARAPGRGDPRFVVGPPGPAPGDRPRPAPVLTIAEVTGAARIRGAAGERQARRGEALAPEDEVRAAEAGSRVVLSGRDGASFVLRGEARVAGAEGTPDGRAEADRAAITLLAGDLEVALPVGRTAAALVATWNARVEAGASPGAATRLVASRRDADITRLAIVEGRARLVRLADKAFAELGAGEAAFVAPGAALVPAPAARGEALFVVGRVPLDFGDDLLAARLEALGFTVIPRPSLGLGAADVADRALVVISSTAESRQIGTRLRGAAVPVISWEPWTFDDLGLIDGADNTGFAASAPERRRVRVGGAGHPLAAGLHGAVSVYATPADLVWARPVPGARVIATLEDDPARAVVFGFERGAPLAGLRAPARRVGLFLFDAVASVMTAEGWALLDAAVTWCMAPGP